jgi:uncharacterized repeat protein (TIGR03803 family)
MHAKSLNGLITLTIILGFNLLAVGGLHAAAVEKVLYYFNGVDGSSPSNGVILRAGNLYGVTYDGGAYGGGTVFELTPSGDNWTETVLYSFTGGSDGGFPFTDLTSDDAGNLYGTTLQGGLYGGGVVFEMIHSQSGWTESVLQSFHTGPQLVSAGPSRVTFNGGKLYGTTNYGGAFGTGAVFELRKSAKGWRGNILYSFSAGSDGGYPSGGLTFDAKGNLYGTTEFAGTGGGGVIFELTPSNGAWTETVLYSFQCCTTGDGLVASGLTMSKAGNLYGTTTQGGTGTCAGFNGCGTVWELAHSSTGWTEIVLHEFAGGSDGNWPNSDLLLNSAGIFGTTRGVLIGDAVVFELTPSGNGWTNTVLLDYGAGAYLYGGLISGPNGSLYGTRAGINGYVFQLLL